MATLHGTPALDISPNPENVNLLNVRVNFAVRFSQFDMITQLQYQECVQIFGVDQIAGEDNSDDLLSGISLTNVGPELINDPPSPFPQPIAFRSVQMPVSRGLLDEDRAPVPNPDELQARVTLTPLLPVEVTGRSNIVSLNLS